MLRYAGLSIARGCFDGIADTSTIDEDTFLTMCCSGAGEALIDTGLGRDVDVTENATGFARDLLAALFGDIEDRDLCAFRRQGARRGFIETGCAAGDHGDNLRAYFHRYLRCATTQRTSISRSRCREDIQKHVAATSRKRAVTIIELRRPSA